MQNMQSVQNINEI